MPDSDADTIIEIKGGSLDSFALSVPDIPLEDESELVTVEDHDDRPTSQQDGSRLSDASLTRSRSLVSKQPSMSTSRVSRGSRASSTRTANPDPRSSSTSAAVATPFSNKSKSRVTIASQSTLHHGLSRSSESGDHWDSSSTRLLRQRQRSIHSQGSVATAAGGEGADDSDGDGGDDEELGRRCAPGPGGDSSEGPRLGDRPPTPLREKIPDGLARLLRDLPEPRELAPLVRSVVISADMPSKHVLHFKSTTKVQRVGLRPTIYVSRAATMRLGRQRKNAGPVLYEPTYWLEPKEVPGWRRVQVLMQDILGAGLKGVRYTSYLAENASRILAATIVQRLKKLPFERYRLVAKVRIAQKLDQGMAMFVACLWDDSVDRFAYVQFENSTVAAQAVLFMVYTD